MKNQAVELLAMDGDFGRSGAGGSGAIPVLNRTVRDDGKSFAKSQVKDNRSDAWNREAFRDRSDLHHGDQETIAS